MSASARILFTLKELLRSFSYSSGLHVNFSKSFLVPINVSEDKSMHLANTFGCEVGAMPFTYLGLPVGTTKPSVHDFSPLVCKVERRLNGVSIFLSYQRRLILVNFVFSALPTFYMCTLQIPPVVLDQIDKYRKSCLWKGGDLNRKGGCLATWEVACLSKEEGGLGIIDLRKQNSALLLKYLDKFYNQDNIPWVLTWNKLYSNSDTAPHARRMVGSFWWKDISKLMPKFLQMAKCQPNRGNSVSFWGDKWSDETMQNKFPHLRSFAKKQNCSIRFFLDKDISRLFHL
jgi:hypothetical protein